jgi:hypothetical protein
VPEPGSVPLPINSQGGCTILRATQAFQGLKLIFLQLKKDSHISLYYATRGKVISERNTTCYQLLILFRIWISVTCNACLCKKAAISIAITATMTDSFCS